MALRFIWQFMNRGVTHKIVYGPQLRFGPYTTHKIVYGPQLRFGPYTILWVTDRSINCHLSRKKTKQSLKIDDPGTHKKRGMLNVIKQLQHFILCNMMCYGAPLSILLSSAP